MPAPPERWPGTNDWWTTPVGFAAGGLLALVLMVGLLVAGRHGESASAPAATRSASPADPAHRLSPGPREPTDADAAEFAVSLQPLGVSFTRRLAADANADGPREIVFASIAGEHVRMDVAAWDGQRYVIVASEDGGPAKEITDLQVRDVTGDDIPEIIAGHWLREGRDSVSIWGWDGATYAPQVAHGGCADGRHTYEVPGAQVGQGMITGTCDGLADVYKWERGAWIYEKIQAP